MYGILTTLVLVLLVILTGFKNTVKVVCTLLLALLVEETIRNKLTEKRK